MNCERVVLVHGLWMRGLMLAPLRRALTAHGFAVETIDFASVTAPPSAAIAALQARMHSRNDTVHLVGHSLGGMMALEACRDGEDLAPGRIVCLGSPLAGSAAARGIASTQLGRWWLGHSRELLAQGAQGWNGSREVGVIAGSRAVGMGRLFAGFDGEHDGTVAVSETRVPGLTDHCVLAVSHSGLVFSADVAAQTAHFLDRGRFRHPASA